MSSSLARCWLFAASFLAFQAAPALAQQGLSLPDAQRIALARSNQLTAQDAAAAAVQEMAAAAGRLPDPVLKLGVENVPINGPDRLSLSRDFMTMRRVGVMQELPRAEKRQLRVERLQRDAQRVQAERALVVTNIQRDTAIAWIERYYTQAILDLLRQQVQETELQVQGAEVTYRTGKGSQADIFGARAAVANLQDKVQQAERQSRSAALMLGRWIGPDGATRPLAGAVPWKETTQAHLLNIDQLKRLPQLGVLAAQVEAAEIEVRQAQANTRSDWTVEAMVSQRGSAYSDMVSIGVSIPLQLDRANRQDREVAAKVASLAEARARFEDALAAHDAEVRVLTNDWEAGKGRVARLTADLLPAARQRAEAAATSYRTGQGDLAALLSARREEIDARMQVLSLEMETARLWAQLNYLTADGGTATGSKEQP
ncbi:TolC family protein [Caenimonas sedimenti]|uniref:TolC family protein n=1 Tax=Caenimonas sedimenti TaxID=2596921 RepID=A0A562ZIA7_9BURK|nr:TolC family protein [Caenimonas sedimenti]TWO68048.1 TolC family protein [Caenimonas sedimenti]